MITMNYFENQRNNINIDVIEKRLASVEDLEDPDDEDSEALEELVDNKARKPRQKWTTRIYRFMRKAVSGAVRGHQPVIEDFEPPQRYRPENINSLCSATGFTVSEMKRMYRGFKTECPNGLVTEDGFHSIFSKFFPLGGNFYNANTSSYSHYVFSSFDQEDTGVITFEDFALGLSVLIRGSLEEKLRWTFNLYDLNGDGVISKEEMEDVTASVFDLMGRPGGEKEKEKNQIREDADVTAAVERVFQKMDLNRDGVVSLDEFLQTCIDDEMISKSLGAFTNVAI